MWDTRLRPSNGAQQVASFFRRGAALSAPMQIHGSCVAREGAAVLLTGPPGSGKSDLVLRLIDCGYVLVADDRVDIDDEGVASPPSSLAGLLEIRGLGIVRLPYLAGVKVALHVELGPVSARLPPLAMHDERLGVLVVSIDPSLASAPARVSLALDCALGRVEQIVGAFAA
jgi:HPr kinase/phosphorylase